MLILGIESSCDDTSVALVDCSLDGHKIITLKTASQIDVHKLYGGVVPEVAGRLHAETIAPLIEEVLKNQPKPEIIAVTSGPGLITGLLVGVEAARTLSYAWQIPLVAVNHLDGHIHSVELVLDSRLSTLDSNRPKSKVQSPKSIKFPALALVVSGGHTELVLMRDHGDYTILGATLDDAAGECFDKVAKLLGLSYPGGPQISKLAETGRTDAINFPRPMLDKNNFDFSFSGLKTSALYWLRDHQYMENGIWNMPARLATQSVAGGEHKINVTINDFCASFETAIIDVLVAKTLRAVEKYHPQQVLLAGGVAANKKLRATLAQEIGKHFPESIVHSPESAFCMDNGAMIAVAGFYQAAQKNFTPWEKIDANPNWKLS